MKFLVLFALVAGAFASTKDCPANAHYKECGTACPITCKNYENPPEACVRMCVSGCFCDEGYVQTNEGKCVKPERCATEEKNCEDKPETGMCRGFFRMWYYDDEARDCKQFVYGGCDGNGNQYATKEQCLRKCASIWESDIDRCQQPPEEGTCMNLFQRYYFDVDAGRCKMFVFSGCGGNTNNFRTKKACESRCQKRAAEVCGENERFNGCGTDCPLTCKNYDNSPKICNLMCKIGCECEEGFVRRADGKCVRPDQCPKREALHYKSREVCNLEKVVGPCRAAFRRFFFNKKTGQCEKFTYGGCQGNENNFKSQQECENLCLN